MISSKNSQKITDTLRSHKLSYLVESFENMLELERLEKIKIHRMEWKYILKEIHNKKNTKFEIEELITNYFTTHQVLFEKKEILNHEKSKERVIKHRANKKALGYKTISVQLSPDDFKNLSNYKKDFNFTYSQAIHNLLEQFSFEETENDFFY